MRSVDDWRNLVPRKRLGRALKIAAVREMLSIFQCEASESVYGFIAAFAEGTALGDLTCDLNRVVALNNQAREDALEFDGRPFAEHRIIVATRMGLDVVVVSTDDGEADPQAFLLDMLDETVEFKPLGRFEQYMVALICELNQLGRERD